MMTGGGSKNFKEGTFSARPFNRTAIYGIFWSALLLEVKIFDRNGKKSDSQFVCLSLC